MAQPTPFVPPYDFSDELGTEHGTHLDVSFQEIQTTTDEVLANLALVQRDDGGLANLVVTPESLSQAVVAMIGGWNPRGAWATSTAYAVRDAVTDSGGMYVALVAHTSGVLATDVSNGKMFEIISGSVGISEVTGLGAGVAAALGIAAGGVGGVVVQGGDLELKSSAGAAPTAEGRVEWDSDDDKLKIGGGAATKTISPDDVAATLANKTLENTNAITVKDANFTVQDDADTTKQAKFDVSEVTAGQTRTTTLANYSGRQVSNARGADIASAGTINLTTATGDIVDVTGTTSITAITLADGMERKARFTGVLTLTNGASLVLPGAANITTAAGDVATFRGYAAGVVRCTGYQRANGWSVVGFAGPFFQASCGVAQNIAAATHTKVQMSTEEVDSAGCYDNATNYRYTPNVAGWYLVHAAIQFNSTSDHHQCLIELYRNGSLFKTSANTPSGTTYSVSTSISCLMYFNGSTDYVEAYGYQNVSGSPTIPLSGSVAHNFFHAHFVGA